MVEPVMMTAAVIAALAASPFMESAAKKAGEMIAPAALNLAGDQVKKLWGAIKKHFAGDPKAEKATAQIEAEQSEAALTKLEVYLDDELSDPQKQDFAQEVRQLAQQIINVNQQQQNHNQTTFNIAAQDEARVNAVGEINNAHTINFGDQRP